MNLCEHLTESARLFPRQEAVVFGALRWDYETVNGRSAAAAAFLRQQGVKRGDRVALVLPNEPSFIVWYFAILREGAIAVSVSTRLTPAEIGSILTDCGATGLIGTAALVESMAGASGLPATWTLAVDTEGMPLDGAGSSDLPEGDPGSWVATEPDDAAVILYTSGTTGFSKGATLSHRNIRATVHAFHHLCGMSPRDRLLLAVPLFHCYGQNALLNAGFATAATIVLQRRFDLEESKRLIATERVTRLFGVPAMFQLLESYCRPADLASIEYCFSAATTLPLQVGQRWRDKFGMPIYEGYGLTETAPFASYNHRLRFKPGTIGAPVDLVEMKIVHPETGADLPPGELGEIAIRGPNVMLGYWNRPAETAEVIRDGWFHSGDIGRVDDEGYFQIVDRVKDMIAIGGMKVFPAEVERVLLDHPLIAEAAVVGFPEPTLGEQVVAFLVAREQVGMPTELPQAADLKQFCAARLAQFKMPRHVVWVDELPRNPAGKVLKKELRERSLGELVEGDPEKGNSMVDEPVRNPWWKEFQSLYPAERRSRLVSHLQQRVAEILNETALPAEDQRFLDIGLDSLMIVELRDSLQRELGSGDDLPATLVFDYPRIGDLADYLLERLAAVGESTSSVEGAPGDDGAGNSHELSAVPSGSSPTGLQSSIESLSEEEALQELMKELND